MALPPIFIVEAVIVEPVMLPLNTAAPVEAVTENVAFPLESYPAIPAEFITTRAPDEDDDPE